MENRFFIVYCAIYQDKNMRLHAIVRRMTPQGIMVFNQQIENDNAKLKEFLIFADTPSSPGYGLKQLRQAIKVKVMKMSLGIAIDFRRILSKSEIPNQQQFQNLAYNFSFPQC